MHVHRLYAREPGGPSRTRRGSGWKVGEGRRAEARLGHCWGVGLRNSTDESAERRNASSGGGRGGKDADQGERSTAAHGPNAEPGRRVPGVEGVREANALRYPSKVGAACGSTARADLCGGREVISVPTATVGMGRGFTSAVIESRLPGNLCHDRALCGHPTSRCQGPARHRCSERCAWCIQSEY